MTTPSLVALPHAVLSSEIYISLNAEQRAELSARLNYCDEIAGKAAKASGAQGRGVLEIIDDIEVDAMSIMSAYDPSVSPWLIHTSWTFDCDRREMAGFVAPEVISLLQSAALGLGTSREHAIEWLVAWQRA